jgi:hypothetical protein
MTAAPDPAALAQQASFVFKGRVVRLRAATMPGIPIDDGTAVVHVEEIVHAPEVLTEWAGQDITVQLVGKAPIARGKQAVFFANGWIFGDSICVRALDHRPVAEARTGLATTAAGDPVGALARRDAETRFEAATLVISGRVTAVRLPPGAPERARAVAAAAPGPGVVSEHDPLVHEAEVSVDRVHKGSHDEKTVRVRFPSSRDVKWYRAPKFRPGQEGVFVLHRDESTHAPERAQKGLVAALGVAPDVADDAYTALHPADFQPADEPGAMHDLLAARSGRGG